MTDQPIPKDQSQGDATREEPNEPGLLEPVGSFPYIILKLIQLITPGFLISKKPPKKNYRI